MTKKNTKTKKTDEQAPMTPEASAPESEEPQEDTCAAETVGTEEQEPVEEEPNYMELWQEAGDKLLRTKAEFDNYRKRVQREFAEIREQTKMLTIHEFLTVYDHFQMALAHLDGASDVNSMKQGMELIRDEFGRTLQNLGVEQITAVGQAFDPEAHEAVAQEPSEDVPEGHVVRQWKAGFRLGDRLLRPATVVVSAGAGAEPEAADVAATDDGADKDDDQ